MVDRGDFEAAGNRLVGKQQQGEAVGAAGYSEADARVRFNQRPQCTGETFRLVG